MLDESLIKLLPKFRKAVLLFVDSKESKGLDCYGQNDLSCACAITSRSLAIILNRKKYKAKLVEGSFVHNRKKKPISKLSRIDINHCWVTLGNYIIDLTASQFINDRIIITTKNDPRYVKSKYIKLNNLRDFKDWPTQQIPNRKITKQIIGIFEKLN